MWVPIRVLPGEDNNRMEGTRALGVIWLSPVLKMTRISIQAARMAGIATTNHENGGSQPWQMSRRDQNSFPRSGRLAVELHEE